MAWQGCCAAAPAIARSWKRCSPPQQGEVDLPQPAAGEAVGSRVVKLDGVPKVQGSELYGADAAPPDALWLRVVRSPYVRARFRFGDLEAWRAYPGLVDVLTARDVHDNGLASFPRSKTSRCSPSARCASAAKPWPRSQAATRPCWK